MPARRTTRAPRLGPLWIRIAIVLALPALGVGLAVAAGMVPTARAAAGLVSSTKTSATTVTVQTLHVRMPQSATVRDVSVYRPNVADSATLPILYFLHGDPGRPGDVELAGLRRTMNRAFASGASPFVVAVPDGNGTRHADTEWADAADGSDLQETFVTRTVIAAVEAAAPRDSAHRAIGGFSMGAYGAANLSLRHPGLYGQVVSLAGYFHVDDPNSVFGADARLIAANSPDLHADAARGKRVLLGDARSETEPLIAGETARFAGLLRAGGAFTTVRYGTGTHSWSYVGSQLPFVIRFLETGWSGAPGA